MEKMLIEKLVQVTREFNDKRIPKRERQALIPIAEAIRSELARLGRTVTVEELAELVNKPAKVQP